MLSQITRPTRGYAARYRKLLISELLFAKHHNVDSYRVQPRRQSSSEPNTRGDISRRLYLETPPDDINETNEGLYERDFVEMTVQDFEQLHKNDEQIKKNIEIILSEYEHIKYDSIGRVPSQLTVAEMSMILEEGTNVAKRRQLFNYLFKREMAKRQSVRRKQREKEETILKHRTERVYKNRTGLMDENGGLLYGLWHNALFSRIPEGRLKSGSSISRLCEAAQFGRKVIFDFGFEDYMSNFAKRNSVEQVQEAYGINRFDYKEPFDFWFCNFDSESFMGQYCTNNAMTNLHTSSMVTVKPDCMTNHFDKSRLVYLSPNARDSLGSSIVKSDDIYIIGVFNDRGSSQPVSLRKANKLGIRTKSLPIDQHLLWQGPNKALCINHVVGVLLEVMSNGGNWSAALRKHIPARKIKSSEQILEEERIRSERLNASRKKIPFNLRADFD